MKILRTSLHGRPLWGAVIVGFLILLATYLIKQEVALTKQMQVEKQVTDAAAFLSSSMNVRLNLTSSLSAFVTTHKEFSEQQFDSFASALKRDLSAIVSLQLAPNGIVTYLTDIEQNRKALGHNLLADPRRLALAQRSIREHSYIIAGPVNLIQGGRAIIARRPIYLFSDTLNMPAFWGFAIVLIDIDSLMKSSLIGDLRRNYIVAIRGRDGQGSQGEVFIGEPATFDAALVIADVQLPNASWQLAVSNGNAQITNNCIVSFGYWILALVIAALSSSATFLILDRPRLLELKISEATRNLSKEVQNRIKAEELARHMAQHDSLTLLPNRSLFEELSELSIASAKREKTSRAVLFIDIDGFKQINDSLGHAAGDQVLKVIAGRLLARVRESDIVARFGGDEFVVMLNANCDAKGAEEVTCQIIEAISCPFNIADVQVIAGASIGIAIYPNHGTSIDELLQKSDAVMYLVKKNGKNSYKFAGPNSNE
ncbi:MAG: diguanylate cyclase [Oceanospirillaceae bacterium]